MQAIRTQDILALKLIAVASRCHINIAISSPGILFLHLVKYRIGLLLMPDHPLLRLVEVFPHHLNFPKRKPIHEKIMYPRE
jgi:hypothetical protein